MTLSFDQLQSLYSNYKDAETIEIPYNSYDNVNILQVCEKAQKIIINYNNIQQLVIYQKFEHLKELSITSNQLEVLNINADLITLNLSNNKFANIDSFIKYQYLTSLNISNNQLNSQQSMRPILSLIPNLSQLNASSCNLKNLSVFLNIMQDESDSKLQLLNISLNPGISLKGLQQCKILTNLDVNSSGLFDITMFSKLLNLKQLNLSHNHEICSLECLTPLIQIQQLDIDEIGAKTLNGLQNMTDLVYLMARRNKFTHVNELEKLTQLKDVGLSQNKIFDLSGLRNAVNIETIQLDGNQLHSLEGLPRYSTKLASLSIYNNQDLKNIMYIGFYPNLKHFCAAYCNLESLQGMENIPKVQRVFIYNNQLKSLKGIEKCKYIKELRAERNILENLDGIQYLEQLNHFDVSNNLLSSIKELEGLKQLERININENQVKSLEGIENILSLQYIDAWSNQISSFYYLKSLKNLMFLNVAKNHISDIRQLLFLCDLPELKRIWLVEQGKNNSQGSNKLCADSDYPNFVIQVLPKLEAFEYLAYYDCGAEYCDYNFDDEQKNKAMEQVLTIPELTEELIKELKEQ
ncbi:leucine-rich_repeat domain-containing protein [Hexamita inflata]|uniref:Leucine-rich_repeat domain-containing protein n=1 Tax=Hexamita inflata TaxID=28002 RepID=A0ABP1HZB5_9EUKA